MHVSAARTGRKFMSLLCLEWRARNGIALRAAQIVSRAGAHELLVEPARAIAPLGVTLVADHDLGALREIRRDAFDEPQRACAVAIAGEEHRRDRRLHGCPIGRR